MKRYGLIIVLTFAFSAMYVSIANAQWVDPIGYRNTPKIIYNYQIPVVVPSGVISVNTATESVPTSVSTSVSTSVPNSVPNSVPTSVPTSVVVAPVSVSSQTITPTRPPVPDTPDIPQRAAVPTNPYDNLPPDVVISRPKVPCGGARSCVI